MRKPPSVLPAPQQGLARPSSFELRLRENLELAMIEGSLYFEERGAIFETLRAVAQDLQDSGIDFAVIGVLAMFTHGYRRFTNDVDLLFSAADYPRARRPAGRAGGDLGRVGRSLHCAGMEICPPL